MQTFHQIRIATPLGFIMVQSQQSLLHQIFWDQEQTKETSFFQEHSALVDDCLLETKQQLEEYFGGVRKSFTIPYHLPEESMHTLWLTSLGNIPYGKTISYAALASQVKIGASPRTAGSAMARNPLPIILPCHRVIRSDGTFGGYSLGGTSNKRFLLQLEELKERKREK